MSLQFSPNGGDFQINPALLQRRWKASWSKHPDTTFQYQTGVFLFRKMLRVDAPPAGPYVIHVSADQRCRLYVNGVSVAWGPARGDLLHWNFESIDLAPYLTSGINTLCAVVHYFAGDLAPVAQISHEAAFLVQGDGEAEEGVNTPTGWKVWRDDAYTFSRAEAETLRAYCVTGPSENMDCARHPWDWQMPAFDDAAWADAVSVGRAAAPYGLGDSETSWWLVPRAVPAMEETPQSFGRIVRAEGIPVPEGNAVPGSAEGGTLSVPPHTKAVLLFDHGVETCAFPEIVVREGAGARVRLAYAEALFDVNGVGEWKEKINRDVAADRILRGYSDTWDLDGGARLLRPLWWKTFRYAELTIETSDAPVTIERLTSVYTGYPFAERARFDAPEMPEAKAIWDIGWRTARLCAHETYMDCPYYEQLQYVGDTRIQCLISLYTSGDARLFRNSLALIDASRITNGLTMSRYPARIAQVIPPFSLWYVGMIDDYRRHVPGDAAFIESLMPGVRGVLDWFRAHLRPDGLLGPLPFWNFVDWCEEWGTSSPPGSDTGGSSVLTLQYILACDEAAGLSDRNAEWAEQAQAARDAVRRLCFDPETMRVADTPEKTSFSQHAAILAILADAIPESAFRPVLERIVDDPSLPQARFYFRFYLNRALVKAGLGDRWLDTLGPWRDMMALGLTTWAETPEPTRSDCHAWSAAPNYEFLATVLGILPGDASGEAQYSGVFPQVSSQFDGWKRIRIAPHLGTLTQASGVVPHPDGEIRVAYKRTGTTLEADITLPAPLDADNDVLGHLIWGGQSMPLKAGPQRVTVMAG